MNKKHFCDIFINKINHFLVKKKHLMGCTFENTMEEDTTQWLLKTTC